MEELAVEVKNLTRRFKALETKEGEKRAFASFRRRTIEKVALDDVSFSIRRGDFGAILGRNGAGKSTLLKVLTGVLRPDSGSATVLGMDPYANRKKLAMRIGAVFGAQNQLYYDLPALDTFTYMRHMYNVPERDFRRRLEHMVELLNLQDVYKKQVRQMSLGQRMKCNFVASMLHNPELVILDEATIGMDVQSKFSLFQALLKLQKEEGTTFLLATNLMDEVEVLANRVVLLDFGKVVFDGPKSDLINRVENMKRIELHLLRPIPESQLKFGKVLVKKPNYVRLEFDRRKIKSKQLMALLSSEAVHDYNVSELGLYEVLNRLYGKNGKKKITLGEENGS